MGKGGLVGKKRELYFCIGKNPSYDTFLGSQRAMMEKSVMGYDSAPYPTSSQLLVQ